MAQFQIYNKAKDALHDFQTSGSYEWMVMKSGTFDPDHDFVADLLPGTNELTVPAYARLAVNVPTRTVDDTSDSILYEIGADPDFGNLTVSGEVATALVLIKVVTNDADSIPIAWGDFTPINTSALNPFVVTVTALLVAEAV